MNKTTKNLSLLLYAVMFGAVFASLTGSLAVGFVAAALSFMTGKIVKLEPGSFATGPTDTLTEEEKLQKQIIEGIQSIKKAVTEKADANEIEKLKLELSELREKHESAKEKANAEKHEAMSKKFDDLEEILKKQGTELAKMKDLGSRTSAAESLADAMVKAYRENIEKVKDLTGGMVKIELKSAGTMTITGNYPGGTVGLSSLEPGLTRIQRRAPFLRQLVNAGNTSSKYVVWIEQANADPGAAGMTSEGSAKTQTDFDLVERSAEVRKVTAYIKVSKEMLADISFIESEIRTELIELINLKIDEQILSGDNSAPNMKGLTSYATAYSAGTFANAIDDANFFDVLRTAISQIETANFMPNYIIMNPADVAKMELTKDLDGRYVMPPFISASGNIISGIPIIANNGMTADKFLVGDFTKSNLRIREDLNLNVGYENDDFTKNLLTILAEARAVHYVKTNHVGAFVYGDFSDAITALETP